MTSDQIRQSYLDFFGDKTRQHKIIPPAPLVPPDDPTTLFTNSGMQQLVPYLKGEAHPMGKRLVDAQPCFRAEDIDEVGDNRHTTFFEMLGNWSLGDYFKQEQLAWFWEWLTKILKLDPEKLHVTVFEGDEYAPKDEESFAIWQKLGVPESRIHYYPAKQNWWSRAGSPKQMPVGEIGGTTSEVFFEFDQATHDKKFGDKCHPNCECGRFLEIGNSVFMEYEKQADGSMKPLPKQNVDFGGGLERLTAAVANEPDVFQTDIFTKMIAAISQATKASYEDNPVPMRVIADHLRGSQAMLKAGIEPGNKQQGYILRRLIRRSGVKMRDLAGKLEAEDFKKFVPDQPLIVAEIQKFQQSLEKGLKLIDQAKTEKINEQFAFDLLQTHGFPFEITQEIVAKKGVNLSAAKFLKLTQKHAESSRTASSGMFKGGLADQSESVVKLHTATHLLHQSLRTVLGDHVRQEGSNITAERLRFDFAHPQSLTEKEITAVEELINQKIKENIKVVKTIEDKDEALESGAMAFFKETYPDRVSVYTIGDFSRELCGGPHVSSTGEIGGVKIIKDQSIGAGKRRLYAVLKHGNKKPA